MVVLNGSNSFSGVLNIDTSSTTSSDGAVRLANPAAMAHVTSPISIRNNNGGSSTLQLSGAGGNITITQALALNGRNSSVPAVENLTGANTLAGDISINVGGGQYWFQSDAGQLGLAGNFSSAASGARTLTFMGAGNFLVSGSIKDGSAIVSMLKTGNGTLAISGTQTYSGPTTVSNGTLQVEGALGSGALTVMAGATLAGNGAINGPVAIQSGGALLPGTLTISNSLTLAGTVLLKLNKAAFTNDSIRGLSTLNYGGVVVVTNLGGTLTAGDSFILFQAGLITGSFSSLTLPSLNTGLAWNTDLLTNGVIAVISTTPPQITGVARLGDGNLHLLGTGVAQVNYQLLATTNLFPPINWLTMTSTISDGMGAFEFFDWTATNSPWRFYRVAGP
jgi:autotransporter-associated beta strand protein